MLRKKLITMVDRVDEDGLSLTENTGNDSQATNKASPKKQS